ncbi:uncharacterized protein LOC130975116 [Arachis stenosperma]|uniref:uncharacterized protein LOC130975116 n=1 Tax=Arachis stenosperma TaxID=217475 RepID=UPI0025AD997D|nr:uncharacterized protein LOC130975116 [Arachis stenosperma]
MIAKACSAIIQRDLPKKLKDLGSFQISCTIRKTAFEKALCDLGTSINLMPLSMMKKLQIKEVKLTRIALQTVDRSMKYACGVVENILVKVGKFFFPGDFVILNMEKYENASIILGILFLATGRALVDVEKGELHDEHLLFHLFKTMHHLNEKENCMKVNSIDPNMKEAPNEVALEVPRPCLKGKEEEENQ